MAKFRIEETYQIISGSCTTTYEVEADSLEEAEEKIINVFNDDTDIEEIETEYDLEDTEFSERNIKEI